MINELGQRQFTVDTDKVVRALTTLYTETKAEQELALQQWTKELKELYQSEVESIGDGNEPKISNVKTTIHHKPQDILPEITKELEYYKFLYSQTQHNTVDLTFNDYQKFFKGEWSAITSWKTSNARYTSAG